MKVLIIGGMGVIGGAITKAAVNHNIDTYIVSRRALFGEWLDLNIHEIQGNWKDDNFAKSVVEDGFDVIVDTQVFNVEQLKRSLDIVNNHCTQYIYISTDSVYEHPSKKLTEDRPIDVNNIYWDYGIDKRKAELYLIENGDKYGFYWTVIRPTITFGNTRIPVGYATKRDTYTLVKRILDGRPIIRFDEAETRHSMCHSTIFGEATVGLFLNDQTKCEMYHISDDYSYTYGEIFDAIENILSVKGIYVKVPTKFIKEYSHTIYEEMIYDKNPEFILDNKKIKNISPNVNYHPNIEVVIRDTLEYLKKNEKSEDREYNLITDNILISYCNNIDDIELRDKVSRYTRNLSEEYLRELKLFKRKCKINNLLYPIKRYKRKLKKVLINK